MAEKWKDSPHSKNKKKEKKDKSLLEKESSDDDTNSQASSVKIAPVKSSKKNIFSKLPGVGRSKDKNKDTALEKLEKKEKCKEKQKLKTNDSKNNGKDLYSYANEHAELTSNPSHPLFNVSLQEAWKNSCIHVPGTSNEIVKVPILLRLCIDHVQENGVQLEGIYRISPPKQRMEQLRARADAGGELALDFQTAHEAAALLKMFLRQMPDHILTDAIATQAERIAAECPCGTSQACKCLSGDRVKALLASVPRENYDTLAYICLHFNQVAKMSAYNKMSLENMGTIMHMTFGMSFSLINILLRNATTSEQEATKLFTDVQIRRFAISKGDETDLSAMAVTLPPLMSASDVEAELRRSDQHLQRLHKKMTAGRDGESEQKLQEEIWELQRIITQLKRQLRHLSQEEQVKPADKSTDSAKQREGENTKKATQDVTQRKSSEIDATCVAPAVSDSGPQVQMFEEKQLLAMNSELLDSIAMERRSINRLFRQIYQEESRRSSDAMLVDTSGVPTSCDEERWASEYANDVEMHERILADIIEEKALIARLRAEIELHAIQQRITDDDHNTPRKTRL